VPPIFPLTKEYIDLVEDRCPGLVPPEYLKDHDKAPYNKKATTHGDIYCVGSMLFYMIEGAYPGEDEFLYYE
jgi:serine/threonine protein kinase